MANDLIIAHLKTAKDCRQMINVLREGCNAVCPQINRNAFLSFPICDNCDYTNSCNYAKTLIYQLQLYEESFHVMESMESN